MMMSPLQYSVPYHSHSGNDKKGHIAILLSPAVTSTTAGSSGSNLLLGLHPELAAFTDLHTGGGALQLLRHGPVTDPAVALTLALSQGVRGHQPFTGHSDHQEAADDLNQTL